MSLETLQNDFTLALLDPERDIPSGLVGSEQITAKRRFAVYRNNVVSSLVEALKTAFPVVAKIVGEEFFEAMAGIYVRNYPPSSPIMMLYGESFPDFLSGFGPVAELAYLPDVARFEQIRREVYHAADAEALPPDFLARVPEEKLANLVFTFHPASAVATFEYPALSLWEWNMAGDNGPAPDFPRQGEDVLFYREAAGTGARRLSPGGSLFLTELAQGNSFGAAAETATAVSEFDLSDTIAALLEARLVVAIT